MYFTSICTIENKPRDRRPRIKNYPLGMSQKWVIQKIAVFLGNSVPRSGNHPCKGSSPQKMGNSMSRAGCYYLYKDRTQKMGNSMIGARH